MAYSLKTAPDARDYLGGGCGLSSDEIDLIFKRMVRETDFSLYNIKNPIRRSKKAGRTRKTREYDDRQIKQLTKKNIWGDKPKYDRRSRRLFKQCTQHYFLSYNI